MQDSFGERLKRLRKNAGLTQAEVAARLDKSASAVRMWELGANEPDIRNLVRLSAIFDCSLDYLLCRDLLLGDAAAVRTNLPVYRYSSYASDAMPESYRSIPSDYLSTGRTYFMLLLDSACMQPAIPQGGMVLIRRQDACMDGQIAFLRLCGAYMLRKVRYCSGGILLSGALESTNALWVACDDDSLEVVGVAAEYVCPLE